MTEQTEHVHIGCYCCGACAEHVEIMAMIAGIENPVCCEMSTWPQWEPEDEMERRTR